MKNLRGFTLIELLVSSAIFITVSVIILSALFVTFRVSRKTEVLFSLRQSGDTVLSQMVNHIRYAASLDDPNSCVSPVTQSEIVVTSSIDGGQTILSCPTDGLLAIASNGAALIDTNRVTVGACSFSCSQTTPHDPPTVTMQFVLYPATITSFSDSEGSAPFQTSVTMRNFTR